MLNEVKGLLSFTEDGVIPSTLQASLMGYPFNLNIQSRTTPQPLTEISLAGECNIESLKNHFALPALSVLRGLFSLNAMLQLTDNPKDLDHLILRSDLSGMAIKLRLR